ncbi:MAG: patatin-like phospholipase family protein [Candidatus Omnitrophota bacterium]
MWFSKKKRKIVLALGGGGARGISNIGVLKALERHFGRDNMPFDMIVGTSIGSLIGAAYCLGVTPEELEISAGSFSWPNIVDLGLSSTGLIKGNKFEEIITKIIGDKGFDDFKIPFALTTTDLETGQERTHTSGDLIKLIRASCSWPGIFSAVEIDSRLLVDGGVRNSIPTKAAREFEATFIFAVDPGFCVKDQKINNVITALIQSVQIMGEELNSYQSKIADILIKPRLKNVDQFDFDKAKEIIIDGETEMEKNMAALEKKLRRQGK